MIAISLITGFAYACPAQAAKPTVDYFSAGKDPKAHSNSSFTAATQGSFPGNSNSASATVKWFEKFDETIFSHKATEGDRVILSRPFNQESERVQQWTETASNVAKRYRQLAQTLKAMNIPGNMPGVKEYRDLTSDWYSDAATIYEDLIRPRPAAKTIEELDSAINDIKDRSHSLAQTNNNLKSMDMSLRRTYRVHLPRCDDALQQYVRSK
jgi:uncharacterized protein YukE